MNGPQHFREAERLMTDAARGSDPTNPYYMDGQLPALAAAQVHATLALAAATAELKNINGGYSIGHGQNSQPHLGRDAQQTAAWREAFGECGEES